MTHKYIPLAIYGLLIILIVATPILIVNLNKSPRINFHPKDMNKSKILFLIALLSPLAFLIPHALYLPIISVSTIFLIGISCSRINQRWLDFVTYVIVIFNTILLSTTLLWWRFTPSGDFYITLTEQISFIGILLLIFNYLMGRAGVAPLLFFKRALAALVFVTWALVMSFTLSFSGTESEILLTMWHHWGAYIASAESLMAGMRIFYDVPAQYGLGPTLLLTLGCKIDCWNSAFIIFGSMSFLYVLSLGFLAILCLKNSSYQWWFFLLVIALASTTWIAFPSNLSTPLSTPSTSGIRFLPPVLISVWLLYVGSNVTKHRIMGALFWFVGICWSPESAFCSTLIYCSIFLYHKVAKSDVTIAQTFFEALRLIGALFCFVAFLWLSYRLFYGVYMDLGVFFVYMLNPPGEMPINYSGPICFFALCLALSVGSSWLNWFKHHDKSAFSQSLLLQVLALSTFSYYLGRSHDNNILNLMPFISLLLIDTVVNSVFTPLKVSAVVAIAAIVGWAPMFGWGYWPKAIKQIGFHHLSFETQKELLNYSNKNHPYAQLKLEPAEKLMEGAELMGGIRKRGEKFEIFDRYNNLQPTFPNNAWSAVHGSANFAFIPSTIRRRMMDRASLHRNNSGWIIVDRSYSSGESWVLDFDASYDRVQLIEGRYYYAIKYASRSKN